MTHLPSQQPQEGDTVLVPMFEGKEIEMIHVPQGAPHPKPLAVAGSLAVPVLETGVCSFGLLISGVRRGNECLWAICSPLIRKGEGPGASLRSGFQRLCKPSKEGVWMLDWKGKSEQSTMWIELARKCCFLSSLPWLPGLLTLAKPARSAGTRVPLAWHLPHWPAQPEPGWLQAVCVERGCHGASTPGTEAQATNRPSLPKSRPRSDGSAVGGAPQL